MPNLTWKETTDIVHKIKNVRTVIFSNVQKMNKLNAEFMSLQERFEKMTLNHESEEE